MLVMYAPPVIHKDVENGEKNDEEAGRPFGLEAEGDHDAGRKTHEGKHETGKCPLSLESYTNEQKDEEDASG